MESKSKLEASLSELDVPSEKGNMGARCEVMSGRHMITIGKFEITS